MNFNIRLHERSLRRTMPATRWPILCLALVALAAPALAQDTGALFQGFQVPGPAINITPSGPVAEAWYGGDGGNICAINDTTLFCSFTDCYIGPAGLIRSAVPPTYGGGNTIAIMTIDKRTKKVTGVRHYFRSFNRVDPHDDPPKPAVPIRESFFAVIEPPTRLQKASNLDKKARIFLRRAVMPGDGNLYIFAQMGSGDASVENSMIIRVSNPNDPPPAWKYVYLSLGNFGPGGLTNVVTGNAAPFYFGNEAFYRDGYLYTYGFYLPYYKNPLIDFNQNFNVYPLRIPLAAVQSAPANAEVNASAEYLTAPPNSTWKPGLFGNDRWIVGDQDSMGLTDFGIRYNKTLDCWQSIYSMSKYMNIYGYDGSKPSAPDARGHSKHNSVWGRTAPGPWGPWTEPVHLYTFPEMISGTPFSNKNPDPKSRYYCYCTSEFPALEPDDSRIVFGYTTISSLRTEIATIDRLYTVEGCTIPNPLKPPPAPVGPR